MTWPCPVAGLQARGPPAGAALGQRLLVGRVASANDLHEVILRILAAMDQITSGARETIRMNF